jgi:hypothetical protein
LEWDAAAALFANLPFSNQYTNEPASVAAKANTTLLLLAVFGAVALTLGNRTPVYARQCDRARILGRLAFGENTTISGKSGMTII